MNGCARFTKTTFILVALLLASWPTFIFTQTTGAPLLTTFTNSTPAKSNFGNSMASVGNGRVCIGSSQEKPSDPDFTIGAAYLFSTSGTLLTTFTVSDPVAGGLGGLGAAVGDDRVLISDPSYGTTARTGPSPCPR